MTTLNDLLAGMKDKDAQNVWGQVGQKFAQDDLEKSGPTYWKRQMGDLKDKRVVRVFMKDNFERTGQNPALELEGEIVVELKTTVLQKAAIRNAIQKGDVVSIAFAQEKTNGRYFNDKLIVDKAPAADGGPGF